jgi:signal transduction histidine kinase
MISETGEVIGVQLVSQDISQQKLYEKELITAKRTLEEQVRERTRHLEKVLTQLQEAQNSIIENEKLAVLGRLSASVAHEVNSPLAAIQSSNGAIKSSFDAVLANLVRIFSSLTEDSQTRFGELLHQSELSLSENISTGLRSAKMKLIAELTENNVPDRESAAEALIQLGLHRLDSIWLPLLFIDKRSEVLEIASQIATLYRSTSIIETATGKATEFIRALRKIAYQGNTQDSPEWFDLASNIETVILLLKSQISSGIELVRNYESRPLILAFPNLLLQVWSNLIQNAIQAMENVGVLTIAIKTIENKAVVEIADTGKGIPEHLKEKIFEPFFTTKDVDKGTGLGLGIVTEALVQNRGFLEFDSAPGKTVFRVNLPLDAESNPSIRPASD